MRSNVASPKRSKLRYSDYIQAPLQGKSKYRVSDSLFLEQFSNGEQFEQESYSSAAKASAKLLSGTFNKKSRFGSLGHQNQLQGDIKVGRKLVRGLEGNLFLGNYGFVDHSPKNGNQMSSYHSQQYTIATLTSTHRMFPQNLKQDELGKTCTNFTSPFPFNKTLQGQSKKNLSPKTKLFRSKIIRPCQAEEQLRLSEQGGSEGGHSPTARTYFDHSQQSTVMNQTGFTTNRSNKQSLRSSVDETAQLKSGVSIGMKKALQTSSIPHKDIYYHDKPRMANDDLSGYYFQKMGATQGQSGVFNKSTNLNRDAENISPRGSYSPDPRDYHYPKIHKKTTNKGCDKKTKINDAEIFDFEESVGTPQNIDGIAFIMEDPNTHYQYGPDVQVKRYQYAENYIKPTERSKFRIFTHLNDGISHVKDQTQTELVMSSRFFNARGESSQVGFKQILSNKLRKEEQVDDAFKINKMDDNYYLKAHLKHAERLNESKKFSSLLPEETQILLMNRLKNHQKEFMRDIKRKSLVQGAAELIKKTVKLSETDLFFEKFNQDQMGKAQEIDPDFIEFIDKNKIHPVASKAGSKVTIIDTLKSSQINDKIFMYKRIDENSEGHNILQAQKQQIMDINLTPMQKYYQDLRESHQIIDSHYQRKKNKTQK
ncbi:hypothetical protein FGO68_gene14235 [Halteria grandinella]|uniref:Uncharacterized protein n=1 Tax=Halteria grandinella TaxID=5974 RepID=A0A8J8T476_HALGN|nr:hypothetical protein FGO68_gene14235 [Halteria grandinella]